MSEDPRLLIIDMTDMAGASATAMLKAAFFGEWPARNLLQVQAYDRETLGLSSGGGAPQRIEPSPDFAAELIERYRPEIILYRPVADHSALHEFAMKAIFLSKAPLITWLMDDWPSRQSRTDPETASRMATDLERLFKRSAVNYAISDGMAAAFGARYGAQFNVSRNGVDPEDWPQQRRRDAQDVVLRYAGSLAPDTTCDAVFAVASQVSRLAERGLRLKFEIRTQQTWLSDNAPRFAPLKNVTLSAAKLSSRAYRKWLSQADILLLAYNFDAATRDYLRFSFANKTPELLASGAAVLAHGPDELETIAYLKDRSLALCVTDDDDEALKAALETLSRDSGCRHELGAAGRRHAFDEMNIHAQRANMIETMRRAVSDIETDGPSSSDVIADYRTRISHYRRIAARLADHAPWLYRLARRPAKLFK